MYHRMFRSFEQRAKDRIQFANTYNLKKIIWKDLLFTLIGKIKSGKFR